MWCDPDIPAMFFLLLNNCLVDYVFHVHLSILSRQKKKVGSSPTSQTIHIIIIIMS